jgi:hypothetical protein
MNKTFEDKRVEGWSLNEREITKIEGCLQTGDGMSSSEECLGLASTPCLSNHINKPYERTMELVFTLAVNTESGPFKYSCASASSRPSTSIGFNPLAILQQRYVTSRGRF